MASQTSLTAIARAATEHHEEQVLAARALENERRVALVRLVAMLLMGLSQAVIGGMAARTPGPADWGRIATALAYFVFSVGTILVLRRATPDVTKARLAPLGLSTVDVGFVVAMNWFDRLDRQVELESIAAELALVITYSILRLSATSLWYTTALAIVAFTLAQIWADDFSWSRWTFVVFVYGALAGLVFWTRAGVRRAFVDLRRREVLSRLVSPKVVESVAAGREDVLLPRRAEVTILFSDVRDFTTFSESRQPEDIVRFLDDYFGRMTQVVQGHDGSVNKFLGDGLLAIWGAPEPLPDHAARAVKAALDMQRVVAEINEHREGRGEPPIKIGIGVHTGVVVAGLLGGGNQSEYTVIGDAVNLASRIEGLTKHHDAPVLVSEATWEALGDRFVGERVGEEPVKGRKAPVVLYAVRGAKPGPRSALARA